jgi:hypothetical protein
MKLWIAVSLLLSAAAAQSGEPVDSPFERLAKVDRFAFGGIGYAGITSQGEKDYKLILARSSAMADFEKLLSLGNPQAKSYALVGVRFLNADRFRELSRTFRDTKEKVVIQSGCIEYQESLETVLKHIEAGEYSRGALSAKPTVVEFWHVGDDGLSQRLAERVESQFERSPNFAIGSGKRPGTLVVTIPRNVEWKLVGKRTQVLYNIEFAMAANEIIGKNSGSCWEDTVEKCAAQIVEDAKAAARRIEPSR